MLDEKKTKQLEYDRYWFVIMLNWLCCYWYILRINICRSLNFKVMAVSNVAN